MKGLQKETASMGVPVFQKVIETAQGGFRLDITPLTVGGVVKAGTPVAYDAQTRIAKILKTAEVHANATSSATQIQVKKGHHFKVGDNIAVAAGGAAYAITVIDTSNAAYDTITVATTLGVALTAGDALFQSSANGAAAATYAATTRGLVFQETDVETGADVAVVIRGTVYERRVPKVNAAVKALVPNLIFSQSF